MPDDAPVRDDGQKTKRRGRPPKLSPEQIQELVALARSRGTVGTDDLIDAYRKKTGIVLSRGTVLKYLREAGLTREHAGVGRSKAKKLGAPADSASSTPAVPPSGNDGTVESDEAPPVGAPLEERRYGYNASHRDPGDESRYPCGLTDAEWAVVKDLFDKPGPGRPSKHDRREMLDACVYVLRSGCSWRMLPKTFPNWNNAYATFRRWAAQGLFERMYDRLREFWRHREGRATEPTAAIIDAQSVKSSPQGGPKGYDAGKKVKGRKRNLVVDTLGLLLVVLITTADVQDRDVLDPAIGLTRAKYPTITALYADGGYAGKNARAMSDKHGVTVDIVRHPGGRSVGTWRDSKQLALPSLDAPAKTGFVVLPKRWIVERNNAWNERPRRMNRDHDRLLSVSTAWIWLTEARMLLRRIVALA